jgi:hypothetical protein
MAHLMPHAFTMGNVLSQSLDIMGKNFWKFCGAVALAWGVLMVLLLPILTLGTGLGILFEEANTGSAFGDLNAVIPYVLTIGLAVVAITTALSFPAASIAFGTVQQLRGEPFSFAQSLGIASRHLLPAGLATLLWAVVYTAFNGILILVGYGVSETMAAGDTAISITILVLCALLGAMFFYGRFMVLVPAIVAERLGFVEGLQRSFRLTSGHTFKIWLVAFIVWVASSVASGVAGVIPLIGPLAINVIATALSAILSAVIYVELRRIKESFGIEEYAAVFD